MSRESGFTPPQEAIKPKSSDKGKEGTVLGNLKAKYRNLAAGVMLTGAVGGVAVEGVKHGDEIGDAVQEQFKDIRRADKQTLQNIEDSLNE